MSCMGWKKKEDEWGLGVRWGVEKSSDCLFSVVLKSPYLSNLDVGIMMKSASRNLMIIFLLLSIECIAPEFEMKNIKGD